MHKIYKIYIIYMYILSNKIMAKCTLLFKSLKPLQKMHKFTSTLQVLLFSLITVYKKRNKSFKWFNLSKDLLIGIYYGS